MPCDTLKEFQSIASYRKSFNGDLQTAKSKPMKFVAFDGFQFDNGDKKPLLVIGAIPTALLGELKGNASKLKAEGKCSFVDNVVQVTLKSGALSESDLRKGLDFAAVKRECKVIEAGEGAVDDDEAGGEPLPPLPPGARQASEAFLRTQAALVGFIRERASAMEWHEAEIKTQQDAVKRVAEVKAAIQGFEDLIAQAGTAASGLKRELKELARDANVVKFQKAKLGKLEAAITKQETLVQGLQKKIEAQRRKLPELELLANKHGASRHGAQTDLGLQARRAATGGISPDQADNVHGVSEARVADPEGAATPLTELRWRKTTLKVQDGPAGKRKVVNATDVLKALITEVKDLDRVATSTASKFHSHELEREAVDRAIAKVSSECVWTEVQDGEAWNPLKTVTVYLGAPRSAVGWGMSVQRRSDPKKAVEEANNVIENFRNGRIDQAKMLEQLDVVMTTIEERGRNGETTSSVPMVKSARVTLGRTSSGWTSITHFPDPTATPPGWSLTGETVRKDKNSPKLKAPAGSQA